jgi:hypothetical protein
MVRGSFRGLPRARAGKLFRLTFFFAVTDKNNQPTAKQTIKQPNNQITRQQYNSRAKQQNHLTTEAVLHFLTIFSKKSPTSTGGG